MYVKFPNAAVFTDENHSKQVPASQSKKPPQVDKQPVKTLWADRPFQVPRGRLIGVRKSGESIEVALVEAGSISIVWLPQNGLLTKTQATNWLSRSTFREN